MKYVWPNKPNKRISLEFEAPNEREREKDIDRERSSGSRTEVKEEEEDSGIHRRSVIIGATASINLKVPLLVRLRVCRAENLAGPP